MPLGVLSAGLVGAIIWVSTPWPAAMVIRGLFELDAKRTVTEMEAFAPTADSLQSQLDVPYGDDGADTTFDLYSPAGTSEALPTVVWIHGARGSRAESRTSTRTCRSSRPRGSRRWR